MLILIIIKLVYLSMLKNSKLFRGILWICAALYALELLLFTASGIDIAPKSTLETFVGFIFLCATILSIVLIRNKDLLQEKIDKSKKKTLEINPELKRQEWFNDL